MGRSWLWFVKIFNWGDEGEKILLPALSLGEKWTLWSHLTHLCTIWAMWFKFLSFSFHTKRLTEDGRFPIHGKQTLEKEEDKIISAVVLEWSWDMSGRLKSWTCSQATQFKDNLDESHQLLMRIGDCVFCDVSLLKTNHKFMGHLKFCGIG